VSDLTMAAYAPPQEKRDRYITKTAAARMIKISVYLVGVMINKGQLETRKIGGKTYITRASVNSFLHRDLR